MYSMRSKCADRLSLAKHNRLYIKHFTEAPYSSHDLFYTRDSQMLYLQSIPDSEEDQLAVVSSSVFCASTVLNSLPSRLCSSTESSSASLGIRSVHRKFLLLLRLLVSVKKNYSCITSTLFVESFILLYHHLHSPSSGAYIFSLFIQ